MGLHVKRMVRRDLDAVMVIETSSFEFAWQCGDFIRCLISGRCKGVVVEHGEQVVGYMIYELHKNRLHILNFAVDPGFRRQGVGKVMVDKLTSKLSHQRRNRILLEVREGNLPAQLFFRSQGFKATRVLKDYYDETDEDAYVFEYRLNDECKSVPRFQLPPVRVVDN